MIFYFQHSLLIIQQYKIKIKKDLSGKILGKIDFVAHSMGYAYAKGILDFLKPYLSTNNTFGNFYVIAPENAVGQTGSSDPKFILQINKFQGVFQYGSDFEDWKCRQNGVAP